MFKRTISAALLLALTACAVGPDYEPVDPGEGPAAPAVARGQFANADADLFEVGEVDRNFWTDFDDPVLDRLVAQALAANHDLRRAEARLRRARAVAREVGLDRFPTVTANGGYTRERTASATFGGDIEIPDTDYYDAGFDAVWELDFFGRTRRRVEAAGASAEALAAARDDARLLIAAEVARSYLELRGIQNRLAVATRNADNQRQTLELTETLLDAGRGTDADVANARAQLEATLAIIPSLEAAERRTVHRLGLLTGQNPTALYSLLEDAAPLPELPRHISLDDPERLIRRRPDIRAAERRLAAATAGIGVAVADLFPRVSLTGSMGFAAETPGELGDSGTGFFSYGPSLSWAAFDLSSVRQRIKQAEADAGEALAAYEQAVLLALEDTENALVGYSRTLGRLNHLQASALAADRAAALAQERYRGGIAGFLEVLDAERRRLETQETLAIAQTEAATSLVRLYKAIAGDIGGSRVATGAAATLE